MAKYLTDIFYDRRTARTVSIVAFVRQQKATGVRKIRSHQNDWLLGYHPAKSIQRKEAIELAAENHDVCAELNAAVCSKCGSAQTAPTAG